MHPSRLRVSRKMRLILPVLLLVALSRLGAAAKVSALDFQNHMRQLWDDHVTYTRLYIISAVANLPDKDENAERLLQNQTDIADAIKPFYGSTNAAKLESLLREHILTATAVLDAAKAGDQAKLAAERAKWYSNADVIASFLSSANPKSWPLSTMKSMMKSHLDITLAEASAYLHKDYSAGITNFDKARSQMLQFADLLSNGIIDRFPKQFQAKSLCLLPRVSY